MNVPIRLISIAALCTGFLQGRCAPNQAYKSVTVTEEKIVVYKTGSNANSWCISAIESRDGVPTLYEYGSIVAKQGKASRRLRVPLDAEFFVRVDGGRFQKIIIPMYCRFHDCIRHKGRIKIWDVQLNIDDNKRVTVVRSNDCCKR